ncbi:hypothetical protein NDU88_006067 [Pleurodeles waltl]|uniref:Uncharacterized protein n=1 Tax=Pleurodeles waltl TaxID=8319 RepID=A0AAV7QN49_PLEWA|nr:hypothetical protein NDU88_006067 [Pleurodeles waltl]
MRLSPACNLTCWQRRRECTGLGSLGAPSRGPAAREESQLLSSCSVCSHVEQVQPVALFPAHIPWRHDRSALAPFPLFGGALGALGAARLQRSKINKALSRL